MAKKETVDDGLGIARVNATLEQLLKLETDVYRYVDGSTEEFIARRNITAVTRFLADNRLVVSYVDSGQDEFEGAEAEKFLQWYTTGLNAPEG